MPFVSEVCRRAQRGWVRALIAAVITAAPSAWAEPLAVTDQVRAEAATALRDYLDRPDDSYGWSVRHRQRLGSSELIELTLTSQTWRELVWQHRLILLVPDEMAHAGDAVLLIEGGRWRDRDAKPMDPAKPDYPKEAILLATLVEQIGSPVAILLNVPRQPIFNGLVEDRIIAHTFEKYLDTHEADWPLLLPMVKSAVRAMDAVGEFSTQQLQSPIKGFTVIGASKRGWTTWLTAAMDERVKALGPAVIDMLNVAPQLAHQHEAWGSFSDRIAPYTDLNLNHRMSQPEGQPLLRIVDPYAYRDRIDQPKLLMLGTNDGYWAVDALNLYWDQLQGPKYVMYVPNADHDLNRDVTRVFGAVTALHRQQTGQQSLPALQWEYNQASDGQHLTVTPGEAVTEVRLWTAHAERYDFRQASWSIQRLEADASGRYAATIASPDEGYAAGYIEVVYPRQPIPLHLSTTLRVVPPLE